MIIGRNGIRIAQWLMVRESLTLGAASSMADMAKRKIASRNERASARSAGVDFRRKRPPSPAAPNHRSKSAGTARRSIGSVCRLPSVSTKSKHRLPAMNSNCPALT
jgi:hypothetical protein